LSGCSVLRTTYNVYALHVTIRRQEKRKKQKRMHVNKVFETEQGTVKFEGELEQAEADMVIKLGLNFLLQQGAFSMINTETDTPQ
jgi:hypothetical protein